MTSPRGGDGTVLVIDRSDGFVADVDKVLAGYTIKSAASVSAAQRMVADDDIGLALIGPSYAHEGGVAECSLLLDIKPDLPIVMAAETITTPLLKAALRAGFRDVVELPLSAVKVHEVFGTVEHYRKRLTTAEEEAGRSRLGKVVTVISPKGGAGKTVAATNIALVLTAWAGANRVVILDADLQFGDVCLALQIDPRTSIVDVARDYDRLDEALLESAMVRHGSGLHVLPGPLEPAMADEVPTEAVVRILAMLKRMFDYVVIDTAPFLDEPVLSILERSDDVLLVVDMDLPSVKNAKLALDTLRLIKYPMERIQLILNRANSKARLDIEELERSLEMEVGAAIPSDKLVPRSVNEGVPVVALYPRSKPARGFQRATELVVDESTVARVQKGQRKSWWRR